MALPAIRGEASVFHHSSFAAASFSAISWRFDTTAGFVLSGLSKWFHAGVSAPKSLEAYLSYQETITLP